jgi:hypothetical protein
MKFLFFKKTKNKNRSLFILKKTKNEWFFIINFKKNNNISSIITIAIMLLNTKMLSETSINLMQFKPNEPFEEFVSIISEKHKHAQFFKKTLENYLSFVIHSKKSKVIAEYKTTNSRYLVFDSNFNYQLFNLGHNNYSRVYKNVFYYYILNGIEKTNFMTDSNVDISDELIQKVFSNAKLNYKVKMIQDTLCSLHLPDVDISVHPNFKFQKEKNYNLNIFWENLHFAGSYIYRVQPFSKILLENIAKEIEKLYNNFFTLKNSTSTIIQGEIIILSLDGSTVSGLTSTNSSQISILGIDAMNKSYDASSPESNCFEHNLNICDDQLQFNEETTLVSTKYERYIHQKVVHFKNSLYTLQTEILKLITFLFTEQLKFQLDSLYTMNLEIINLLEQLGTALLYLSFFLK